MRIKQSAVLILSTVLMLLLGGCGGSDSSTSPPPVTAETDTDGDGLADSREAVYGTSPLMKDTDGDGIDDKTEIDNGGYNPLIAEMPMMELAFAGQVDVSLKTTTSASCTITDSQVSASLQSSTNSYSQSDSRATRTALEMSASVSATASASGFPPAASAEVTASASVSESTVQESSTTFSQESQATAQTAFENAKALNCFDGTDTTGGTVTIGITIRNPSKISYALSGVNLTLLKGSRTGSFTTLGTVVLPGSYNLAPSQTSGILTVEVPVSTSKALDLVANPSGLFFEVGSYNLLDEQGRNYAFVQQNTLSSTALVVIDFGPNAATQPTRRFLVATNVARDAKDRPLGVKMSQVMSLIQQESGITGYTTELVGGTGPRKVLASINSIGHDKAKKRFWYVMSSAPDLDTVDFDDIVLKNGQVIRLVLVQDADTDGLMDHEEYIVGSDPAKVDTDGDGLTDTAEVKDGWVVQLGGYKAYSDPNKTDTDGDGLSDSVERTKQTDPRKADTDGDGVADNVDADPLGVPPTLMLHDLKVTRIFENEARVRVTGTVSSASELSSLNVVWGDGTQDSFSAALAGKTEYVLDVTHAYSATGVYTLQINAGDVQPQTASASYTVNWTMPKSIASHVTFGGGWRVRRHPHFLADVNGDGKQDLVSFANTEVMVALADGTGGLTIPTTSWLAGDFGADHGWTIDFYLRDVIDMNKDNCADIIGFASNGVRVALSNCTNAFLAPATWTSDFAEWSVITKPRIIVDVNNDGHPDVIGFSDQAYLALSKGDSTGFNAKTALNIGFGTTEGWTEAYPRLAADLDGDGNVDIIGFGENDTWVSRGNGAGGFAAKVAVSNGFPNKDGWIAANHPRHLADVNGDGKLDLVGLKEASVKVALNCSTPGAVCFSPAADASTEFDYNDGWRTAYTLEPSLLSRETHGLMVHPRWVKDINGDGRADLLGIGSAATWVAYGTAQGTFGAAEKYTDNFGSSLWHEDTYLLSCGSLCVHYYVDYYWRLLGDVTGDGLPEPLGINEVTGRIEIAPNSAITRN